MQTLPINVRIPRDTADKIAEAVRKTGLTKADVMRAAMELGIEDLLLVSKTPMERIKDEVDQAKSKRSESSAKPHPQNKRSAG